MKTPDDEISLKTDNLWGIHTLSLSPLCIVASKVIANILTRWF